MNQQELILSILKDLDPAMEIKNPANNKQLLVDKINRLIVEDFNKLVFILYRLDVNEEKLKKLLKENTETDGAKIIADLIIERQLQKVKSRQQFQSDNNISENERW